MPAPFSIVLAPPSSPITHTCQDGTSTYLASAHSDNSVSLWKRSLNSWDLAATLAPQRSDITDICFSPDTNANTFAICKTDGTATIFTYKTAVETTISPVKTLCDADTLSAIDFSDTGNLATLGGGAMRIYGKNWRLLTEKDVKGSDLSFAPGGGALIAGGSIFRRTGEDFEWNEFASIDNSDTVRLVEWGRDGLMAVGRTECVEIWELRRGQPARIANFDEPGVQSMRWDPLGGLLTTVHKGDVTKTWGKDGATWEWGSYEGSKATS